VRGEGEGGPRAVLRPRVLRRRHHVALPRRSRVTRPRSHPHARRSWKEALRQAWSQPPPPLLLPPKWLCLAVPASCNPRHVGLGPARLPPWAVLLPWWSFAPVAGAAPFKHNSVIPGNPVEGAYTSPVPPGSPSYSRCRGPDPRPPTTTQSDLDHGRLTDLEHVAPRSPCCRVWTPSHADRRRRPEHPAGPWVYSQQDGVSVSGSATAASSVTTPTARGSRRGRPARRRMDRGQVDVRCDAVSTCFDDHSSTVYGGAVSFNIVPTSPTEGY